MKKIFIILILFMANLVAAAPTIQNIGTTDVWLGNNGRIVLNCSDPANDIERVYSRIIGPEIILPEMNFVLGGSGYYLDIDKSYLDRAGAFNATVFCKTNESEVNSTISFDVSMLTGYITNFTDFSYPSKTVQIGFIIKKNDMEITSGVSFNVYFNNQQKTLKLPPAYDTSRGWLLWLDTPDSPGTYNVLVTANYSDASFSESRNMEISNEIIFELKSMDKTSVKENDNITAVFSAFDKGTILELTKNDVSIRINENDAAFNITKTGNSYSAIIVAPNLQPGKYDLKIRLLYRDGYVITQSIHYPLEISGKMLDKDNRQVNTEIKFLSNNVEKYKFYTDSTGSYSGSINPDIYDINFAFPQANLKLERVFVNSFNDPIRYTFIDHHQITGISNSKVYIFNAALSFYRANIEFSYSDSDFLDETKIKVFKCPSWSPVKLACNSNWLEFNPQIDTVRNKINITTDAISVFALGEKDSIDLKFNIEDKYRIKDLIKINGIASDSYDNPIDNASVSISINGVSYRTTSNENGVFSFEMLSPEEEGNYTLYLRAEKQPYIQYILNPKIEVTKIRAIAITAPDSIKIKKGENYTQEIIFTNTGDVELYNLRIEIMGPEEKYFFLTPLIEKLSVGEEKRINLYFFAPEDSEVSTKAATIKLYGDGIAEEKTFGFTIMKNQEEETNENPITGFSVASAPIPKIDGTLFYLVIFAIFCFSIAIIMKNRKKKEQHHDNQNNEIRSALFDIKNTLNKKDEKKCQE